MKHRQLFINLCILLIMGLTLFANGCAPSLANAPPEIPAISASSLEIATDEVITLHALSADPDGDALEYLWFTDSGAFTTPHNQSTEWKAPANEGKPVITVEVSDGRSRAKNTITIEVTKAFSVFPADTRFPPAGAESQTHILFTEETKITPPVVDILVTIIPESEIPAPVPYGKVIVIIDVLPDGMSFTPPAQLNFYLPTDEYDAGDVLDIMLYDEEHQVWLPAGEAVVDARNEFALGQISHTSIYALVDRNFATPTPAVTPIVPTSPPAPGCVIAPPGGWTQYRVQPGDTLYSLARRTGTTVDNVRQVNCLFGVLEAYEWIWLPRTPIPDPSVTPSFTPTPTAPPVATNTPTPSPTSTAPPVGYADLTIDTSNGPTISVDCPGGTGTCVTVVSFDIGNVGVADAGPFTIRVVMDPQQSVVVDHSVAGLATDTFQPLTVVSPPGGNCYDPNCSVCITVDINNNVTESNENNLFCRTRKG